ncbi:universal stress protein [Arthrobacter deserti]|uniref:Universal stress protein n=1 Tax=Arthrobacter deserti TaxID=1742687 RepID=A0ABX1JN92_9MICC|nr:universal stress protein [Arthrobacter deserti]
MDQVSDKVVVGVDGSGPSIEGLRLAALLAPALNARVHAVSCWHFPRIYEGYVPPDFEAFQESARKTLAEALEKAFGSDVPENLTTELVRGPAPEMLVQAGADARLLVVGRRGRGGFRGLHLGSVGAACVAHAACPVLVLHEDGAARTHRWHRGARTGGTQD